MTRFKDIDLNFTAHPVTGDIAILTDDNAIKRSVRNLVKTNFHERLMRHDIGSGVTGMLFENATPVTEMNIEKFIRQVILNYEPRAEVIRIDVAYDNREGGYEVHLVFRPINTAQPVELQFMLERTR